MPKIALIFAFLILFYSLCFFGASYFEGLGFHKAYSMALLYIGIFLMPILALGYLGTFIATIVSVLRKNTNVRQLLLPTIPLLLVFSIPAIPFPTFTDGLRVAVGEKLDRDKLIEFAEQAKLIAEIEETKRRQITSSDMRPHDTESASKFEMIKDIYPEALSLGLHPARVDVSSDEVRIFYGSALVKHWGYSIVDDDTCPIDRLTEKSCQRVFEKIWVYSDIY